MADDRYRNSAEYSSQGRPQYPQPYYYPSPHGSEARPAEQPQAPQHERHNSMAAAAVTLPAMHDSRGYGPPPAQGHSYPQPDARYESPSTMNGYPPPPGQQPPPYLPSGSQQQNPQPQQPPPPSQQQQPQQQPPPPPSSAYPAPDPNGRRPGGPYPQDRQYPTPEQYYYRAPAGQAPLPQDHYGRDYRGPIFTQEYAQHPPPQMAQAAPRQRTSIACKYCRKRKIRCTGYQSAPGGKCQNCARMGQECVFQPVSSSSSTAFVPVSAVPGGVPPGTQLFGAYGQPLSMPSPQPGPQAHPPPPHAHPHPHPPPHPHLHQQPHPQQPPAQQPHAQQAPPPPHQPPVHAQSPHHPSYPPPPPGPHQQAPQAYYHNMPQPQPQHQSQPSLQAQQPPAAAPYQAPTQSPTESAYSYGSRGDEGSQTGRRRRRTPADQEEGFRLPPPRVSGEEDPQRRSPAQRSAHSSPGGRSYPLHPAPRQSPQSAAAPGLGAASTGSAPTPSPALKTESRTTTPSHQGQSLSQPPGGHHTPTSSFAGAASYPPTGQPSTPGSQGANSTDSGGQGPRAGGVMSLSNLLTEKNADIDRGMIDRLNRPAPRSS